MWNVWEEDQTGEGLLYQYATREQARNHVRRVKNNKFLSGWLVRGCNAYTGDSL